jgi:RNA polymerase sigma-70 factor, ECF subfamily
MNDSEEQFSRIFADNRRRIYRLCYSYLDSRSLVDDLFQEIWLNIWRALPSFRGEAQVSTWLYRIAVNTALLFNQRTRRRRVETPLDPAAAELPDARVNPEEETATSQKLDRLRRAIATLSGADRLLIALYLEGASYRELSQVIGISVDNVGVRLNRLRTTLSRLVEGV